MSKRNSTQKPAALYVRMSTTKQDASPKEQREVLRPLIENSGYYIRDEYFDEGISGNKVEERGQFIRMLQDAQAGNVNGDGLHTGFNLDRLGESLYLFDQDDRIINHNARKCH